MSAQRDLPPDEHLRAALRHAPDADVQAPRDIGERLLAEARRAVLPAAPPPAEPAWRRWFSAGSWLPQGALASLLIAGLVTLLWQPEETPGPTVASRAPDVAGAAPAAPASAAPAPVVMAEAAAPKPQPQAQAAARAPARAAKAAPAPEPRAAAEAAAEPVVVAAAPAPTADNALVAEARPAPPAPAAAPAAAAAAPPAALQRLRAPMPAGALRAAASARPPPWEATTPVPPALQSLADRVTGPWVEAAQPAGQPLLAWQHEGSLIGRAWLERRGDAEWLVWCGAGAATCREAPLDKEKAPPR